MRRTKLLSPYLLSLLADGNGAGDFCGTPTIDDFVLTDEVPDNTEGVMQTPLGLLDDLTERNTKLIDIRHALFSRDASQIQRTVKSHKELKRVLLLQ